MRTHDLAIYLHIPFCTTRCHYCDFNTYTGLGWLQPALVAALIQDIRQWQTVLPPALGLERPADAFVARSIFLGGGTPSLLAPEELEALLAATRETFPWCADCEVTAEANPGTVTLDRLCAYRSAGLNRLSLGIQSFVEAELRWLGRTHTVAEAVAAVHAARAAGFDNLNIDLIYGLPGQSVAAWRVSLEQALALAPEHLSAYALTIEEGTALGAAVRRGTVSPADEETVAAQYELTEWLLDEAGYVQYEISNWARPGYACRHNLAYWRNQDYLGFGPGAHSHFSTYRFSKLKSPQRYIRAVKAGEAALEMVEAISPTLDLAETAMLALRLNEGLDRADLAARPGRDSAPALAATLDALAGYGLVERSAVGWRLTARGRLLSDTVFVRLFETLGTPA